MNPPFGEPVPETKGYLKNSFPWAASGTIDLLAFFVARGIALCRPHGLVGAITSRNCMFLTTFERWRVDVMLRHGPVVLADLGHGVMEQAMVEAAAYVLQSEPTPPDHQALCIRLLRDSNRPAALDTTIADQRSGRPNNRLFAVTREEIAAVPGSPVAYWMPPSLRRLFVELPPIEGNAADVRQGLATADDFRFVRAFWEVDPVRVGRSREETLQGKRWVPFAKGGDYSPYWADIHLAVDWEDDGKRLREFDGAVIRNERYYFQPGLTWPRRTNSGFGVRVLPGGSIFADKGPAAIPIHQWNAHLLSAWLNSRLVGLQIEAFGVHPV